MTRVAPIALFVLTACRTSQADTATIEPAAAAAPAVTPTSFAEVLAMPHRSADNRGRDRWRHPAETLAFFGVEPQHTVAELWPGGGWYTEILAPYVRERGHLIVTGFDPNGPKEYYGTAQTQQLVARISEHKEIFGNVDVATVPVTVEFGPDGKVAKTTIKPFELAQAGSVDVVVTFRNSHGWYRNDTIGLVYGAVFRALKPGGIFGVEQHRAAEGADPNQTAAKGYLPEATVIEAAKAAGFELVERSEVNANPQDTRDHPHGVWSLPPALEGGEVDRAKYEAVGESDRMTLKFRKPTSG